MHGDASRPTLRNASPTGWPLARRYAVARAFDQSTTLTRMAIHLGELADYMRWLKSNFGPVRLYRERESLWERIIADLPASTGIVGVEFGVAWGYATQWWLDHLDPAKSDVRWTGFDTFEGLPEVYRTHGTGTFTANGAVPEIADPRVSWRVGLVQDTVRGFELERQFGERALVLFDLDLYGPSVAAWDALRDHLEPGDVLYFDEAYDANERRLLDEHVLPSGSFRALGATTQTLALQVCRLG